jgi:hypothetical protein
MSKILKFLAFFFLLSNYSLADVTSKALSKVSEKISEKVLSVIAEFDIELSSIKSKIFFFLSSEVGVSLRYHH